MFKRQHFDGTSLTSSETSSVMDSNTSAMSRITSKMNSASFAYAKDGSMLDKLGSLSASNSNNPFTLDDQDFNSYIARSAIAFKQDRAKASNVAPYLSSAYDQVSTDNRNMMFGTPGERLAKQNQQEQAEQSTRALKMKIAYEPGFSASYSASQSASASFADLPQSKQTSLLNSLAAEKRMNSYSGSNGNVDGNWTLSDYNN